MTTTIGLVAAAYGSVVRRKFSARDAPPEPGRLPELPQAEDDRLPVSPANPHYAFGAALVEPADPATEIVSPEISFGPFCLRPEQRVLLEAGRRVRIGGRALDLLVALVDRAGERVTKEDLFARVWPNVLVSEGNLKTQIAVLRVALGDGRDGARYVVSIPGRGYCFVAPLTRSSEPPHGAPPHGAPPAAALDGPIKPPVRSTRLIGREGVVRQLLGGLQRRRFVTIVGPGGIGKTSVALAVAEALEASCKSTVCFVDLSQLSDPAHVMGALASALGVAASVDGPTERVIAFLRGGQALIVLDCCERVVDGAAVVAERLLEGSPDLRILATSREALRAEGEVICRLPALETPPDIVGLTAVEALTFPAIQLFVERVTWTIDDFELSDADAPIVADICRRLDGLPLAIELAAGHVHAFGARELAELLGRFRLLMRGRRTAMQRHQTLGAALDWSYETLSEPERAILRRLSAFAGAFTLDDACAIGTDAAVSAHGVAEILENLVAKSLLQADVKTFSCCYRLLETTRTYIQEKLAQSGEMHDVARRHAEYIRSRSEPSIPFAHSIEGRRSYERIGR